MPFGYTASVVAWERVGRALTAIIRRILRIPLLRYVDDLFTVTRESLGPVIKESIAAVITAVLGVGAIAGHKSDLGSEVIVLGITVILSRQAITFRLPQDKKERWLRSIHYALSTARLTTGAAATLGGRLGFMAQSCFRRIGRAMIRPVYERQHASRHACAIAAEGPLETALKWWAETLECDVAETHDLLRRPKDLAVIICDAASTPPVLAAVVEIDGVWTATVHEVQPAELDRLQSRGDNQIMALEALAIVLALASFGDVIKGRDIVIFSDNSAVEFAVKRGSAKSTDHNRMVHWIWMWAFKAHSQLFTERVPTDDNVADGPSRGKFEALRRLSVNFVPPLLPTGW
jgi:hypothetical protein